MTYVCSDVHGEYDLFLKLLEAIRFGPSDVMYVCGDVVDKGADSIKLLKFIFSCNNVMTVMGNHEYDFVKHYHAVASQKQANADWNDILCDLQRYFDDGSLLDWDTVDVLDGLPFYVEKEKFICVHAGIPVESNNKLQSLSSVAPESFVYDRSFKKPSLLPDTDKCVFFGHTPSLYLVNKPQIIKYPKVANPTSIDDYCKIHLDVGTWICGVLGCICVETMQEFYVKK